MARRYSSYYSNPYGRTYRRPKKFKTLFKHIATDAFDSAIYNAFDSPEAKMRKELNKQKAKKILLDSKFLNSELDLPIEISDRVEITVTEADYLVKADEILRKFKEVTEFKIRLQNRLADYQSIIDEINEGEIVSHRVSSNTIIWLLLVFFIFISLATGSAIIFLIGFIVNLFYIINLRKKERENVTKQLEDKKNRVQEVANKVDNFDFRINFNIQNSVSEAFNRLSNKFEDTIVSVKIWDVLSKWKLDNIPYPQFSRKEVGFKLDSPSDILSNYQPMYLANADGADFFLYPLFILAFDAEFISFLDYRDLEFIGEDVEFMESLPLPPDATIIGERWERQNKDGSQDKRFSGNKLLPIVRYFKLNITDGNKINETYLFSSLDKGAKFSAKLRQYQDIFNLNVY